MHSFRKSSITKSAGLKYESTCKLEIKNYKDRLHEVYLYILRDSNNLQIILARDLQDLARFEVSCIQVKTYNMTSNLGQLPTYASGFNLDVRWLVVVDLWMLCSVQVSTKKKRQIVSVAK